MLLDCRKILCTHVSALKNLAFNLISFYVLKCLMAELANVAQASVNPKAETVEELQRRRKGLHMGMCKLLREDLSIIAEKRAAMKDQEVRKGGHAFSSARTLMQVAYSILT